MVAKNTTLGIKHKKLFNGERLFVAVVRQAIKDKDYYFLGEGECLYLLAEILGVSGGVCDCIKINLNLPLE